MRDVVTGFYVDVLKRLVANGTVSASDSILVVCGGPLDKQVMDLMGFANVTITNLDDGMADTRQDAENLSYDDGSFDLVVVHAGLHHCYSPHRGFLEMYRVARKCALAFEARDSLLMRLELGLTHDYELKEGGGVANGPIPNFIYRWTERDVIRTIASFDPAHKRNVQFFYDLRLPVQRWTRMGSPIRFVALLIEPLSRLYASLLPKQCNEFAFAVSKTRQLQPWMQSETKMFPHYVNVR